ncbi:MAG: hypothetical protein M5U26_14890 [Planctomycetota bacterium]|nr:hypothetical protein [Planctomycetota bacterium]
MLLLSTAKITVRGKGEVRVEGRWATHRIRIARFLDDLGLERVAIRLRFGRIVFSGDLDAGTQQRLRNFLVNECPVKRG